MFLYRCPKCRKRELRAITVACGKYEALSCRKCDYAELMDYEKFVKEIHQRDSIAQK